ncbi:MAG: hypothetical protein LBT02_00760 [Rickettsiales bacterium]|jgi:alternate F1F0 ATPase F1 subunit epsilon|nr:hypothetical protein [Rickettsiales bacterium]
MFLEIYIPNEIVIKTEIKKLSIKLKEGLMTFLPKHADYIATFDKNIMHYIGGDDKKNFVALNIGLFVKYGNKICITTYLAVDGETLDEVNKKLKLLSQKIGEEKKNNENLKQLDVFLYNNIRDLKI